MMTLKINQDMNLAKKLLLIITVVWISNFGFSQPSEIIIKFIGNCGLHITDGESNFYIDFPYKQGAYRWLNPKLLKYDKARIFGTYNKSEIDSIKENAIFIFTHRHLDHYSKKILKKLDGKIYDPWNVAKLAELNSLIPNFDIQAFKTKHKIFGISWKHYSYLITWHGKKIYISGDTGDVEHVSKIKDIDWFFTNHWLYTNVKNEKVNIDAKNIAIYHLKVNVKFTGEIPNHLLILTTEKQGDIIRLPFIQY
jgi:ribonuclease BN (tRNA processing enzyme)